MSASIPQNDDKRTVDTADLTEQLKASLEVPVADGRAPRKTAVERARDEELQALLREQLDKSPAPRSTGLMDMITAELADFEIEEAPVEVEIEEAPVEVEIEDEPVEIEEEIDELEEIFAEDDIPTYDETEDSVEEEPIEEEPIEEEPIEEEPIEEEPVEEEPIEEEPIEEELIEEELIEEEPIEEEPVEEEPIEEEPVEEEPVEEEPPMEYERFTMPHEPAEVKNDRPVSADAVRSADDRLNGSAVTQTLSDARLKGLDEDTRGLIQRLREAQIGVSSHEADVAIAETFNHGELDGQMDLFSHMGDPGHLSEAYGSSDGSGAQAERGGAAEFSNSRKGISTDPLQLGLDLDNAEETVSLPDDYWQIKGKTGSVLLTETHRDAPTDEDIEKTATKTDSSEDAASNAFYTVAKESDEQRRDTELYIRLGYETDVNRVGDAVRVGDVKADYIRASEADRIGTKNIIPAVYRGKEYTGQAQTTEFEQAYRRARRRSVARLCVIAVCALLGMVYDSVTLWGGAIPALADFTASRWFPLGGVLLLLAFALPHVTRLARGLRSLWVFEPVPYAVPGLSVLIAMLHGIISGCVSDAVRLPATFVGVAMCALVPAVLSDVLTVAAEQRSFAVVSSGKRKFVVTETGEVPAALRERSERIPPRLSVKKTRQIVDFFMWANRYNRWWSRLNYFVPLSLLGALVGAGLTVFNGGTLMGDGLHMFVTIALTALPVSLAVVFTLPLLLANRIIGEHGSTVVGAATPRQYVSTSRPKQATTLIFGDGAALKATNIKEITVKDDPHTEIYRQMAEKIFALLGNPLDNSYADAYRHELEGLRLEIVEARPSFVHMYLVNTQRREAVEVMMGTHAELTALGIRLPKESMERMYKKSADSRVMYMAFDRRFRLAYAAEYRVRRSFAAIVHTLARDGYALTVTTCDPMVSEGTMHSRLLRGAPSVTMMRTEHFEDSHDGESSGLIATGRATDLVYPLRACHAMQRAYRRGSLLQWPIALLAMLWMTLLGVHGHAAWLHPLAAALWQTVWTAIMALAVWGSVNRDVLSLKQNAPITPSPDQKNKKGRS